MLTWRKQYITGYLVILFIGFFLLLFIPELNSNPYILLLFGLVNLFMYLKLGYMEMKYVSVFSIINFYILFVTISSGIGFVYNANRMLIGEEIGFANNFVANYINKGTIVVCLENYGIISGYFLLDTFLKRKSSSKSEQEPNRKHVNVAILFYFFVWIMRLFFGDSIKLISSQLSFVTAVGCGAYLISLTFLSFDMNRGNRIAKFCFVTITLVELLLCLKTDSKLVMIFPLFPFFIYIWSKYKSKLNLRTMFLTLIALSLLVMFFNSFIYPLSILRRNGYEFSISEYIKLYMNGSVELYMPEKNASDNKFLNRFSVLASTAYCVNYADLNGHDKGIEIFNHSLIRSIPQIIYPDKPALQVGTLTSIFAYGTSRLSVDDFGTFTALGLGGASYLSFGLLFVVFSSLLIGCVLNISYRIIINSITFNPISLWYYWSLVYSMTRFFEGVTDGGFLISITCFVFYILIKVSSRFFIKLSF